MNSGGRGQVMLPRLAHVVKASTCERRRRQRLVTSTYGLICRGFALLALAVICSLAAKPAAAARPDQKTGQKPDQKSDLPEGFAIDLKASEADVLKAVDLVAQDTVLHGTQVYSRED